jgi:hypothetical protein
MRADAADRHHYDPRAVVICLLPLLVNAERGSLGRTGRQPGAAGSAGLSRPGRARSPVGLTMTRGKPEKGGWGRRLVPLPG